MPPSISELVFWLAATVCAVAQFAVIRAALAGRTPGTTLTTASRIRELFWVVLPAGILLFVLVWTWQSLPSRARSTLPVSGGTTATSAPHILVTS